MPVSEVLPAFWLAAGDPDRPDVVAAANFKQLLLTRGAKVPLIIPGGGHQGSVWRAALGPMLTWMTPQLARAAAKADAAAAAAAAKAAAARKAHDAKPRSPHYPGRAREAVARQLNLIRDVGVVLRRFGSRAASARGPRRSGGSLEEPRRSRPQRVRDDLEPLLQLAVCLIGHADPHHLGAVAEPRTGCDNRPPLGQPVVKTANVKQPRTCPG